MSKTGTAQKTTDEDLVLDTIGTYLEALHKADKALFGKAFAETTNVLHCSISEEKISVSNLAEFIKQVDGMHKDHGYIEEFHFDPVVTVSGPVASVHVPFTLKLGSSEVKGTDVFALARIAGEWKIVSKLYSA
jgi:hypothetical protein